jgi:F0F1-type ATP synthase delta subunit
MNESGVAPYTRFVLPPSVVSKVDLSHIVSELERVDNELTTLVARAKVGVREQPKIVLSQPLTDFLTQNKLGLNDSNARTELIKQMRALKDAVPTVHMTFAVTADSESLSQLAHWLRTTVHPQAVIAVGLQPALVGGVYLRTPNHIHDFSLRALLHGKRGLLAQDLEVLSGRS